MRALRVVGVTGEGSVVLEDPGRRERYTVPADEQLRAAARGDVTRLGQIAIELESQLRPREIQARIRGGASVDEVAAAAGVPVQKIERFAYPVLLERSRTAELAQGAHPQRADGPDTRTLGETVAHTFGLRGQDYTSAGWDSWKGEDGKWVVVLTWQTGRTDNAAHWAFQPGAHGGTVVPLDEYASDLVEGLPARPLRPLGAVVDMAREDEATPVDDAAAPARAVAAGGQAPPPADAWSGRGIAPEQRRSSPPARPPAAPARTATRTERDDTRTASAPATPAEASRASVPAPAATDDADPATSGATDGAAGQRGPQDGSGDGTVTAPPAASSAPANGTGSSGGSGPAAAAEGAGRTAANGTPLGGAAPGRTASDGASAGGGAPADAGFGDAAPAGATSDGAAPAGAAPAGAGTGGVASDGATPGGATSEDTPSDDAVPGTPAADGTVPDGPATTASGTPATEPPTAEPTDAGTEPAAEAPSGEAKPRGGGAAARRNRKGKPVMPSWDEVLLGVRGQR